MGGNYVMPRINPNEDYESFELLEQAFLDMTTKVVREWGSMRGVLNNSKAKAKIKLIGEAFEKLGIDVQGALPHLIAREYAQGSDFAVSMLAELSTDISGINEDFKRQVHAEAVQELILDTGSDLQAAIRTAFISGTTNAMSLVDNVTTQLAESLTFGQARKAAQKELMREFAQHGLTSFITSDGKRLPLDFYAQTVVRTKRKEANVKGQLNRYEENGVQYVKINRHQPACRICSAHFDVIIQISGEPVAGIPHISNTKLPPFHPNCKCSMTPIRTLEGETIKQVATRDIRSEAQRRTYNAEQKIRRKANQERKLYEKMKAEGVQVPATLGAFRRQIRKDDESWKALQAEYQANITKAVSLSARKANRDPARKMADREFINQWRENRNKKPDPKPERPRKETLLSRDTLKIDWKKEEKPNFMQYTIDINGEEQIIRASKTEKDIESVERRLARLRDHKRNEFTFEFQNALKEGTSYDYDFVEVFDRLYNQYRRFDQLFKAAGFEVAITEKGAQKLGKRANNFLEHWDTYDTESLNYYTGSAYREINSALRQNKLATASSKIQKHVRQMDKAFKKFEIDEDLLVVRGSGYEAIGGEAFINGKKDPKSLIGMQIQDHGYMSTSISTTGAFGGDVQLQIMLPKGTKHAVYVADISSYSTEYEVVLDRGTKLRVVDAITDGYNIKLLCEVIGNEKREL
jgi:hypothetical protein